MVKKKGDVRDRLKQESLQRGETRFVEWYRVGGELASMQTKVFNLECEVADLRDELKSLRQKIEQH